MFPLFQGLVALLHQLRVDNIGANDFLNNFLPYSSNNGDVSSPVVYCLVYLYFGSMCRCG